MSYSSYSSYSASQRTVRKAVDVALALMRLIVGGVFVFSGFVKAVDPLGTMYKIEEYLAAFGGFFVDMTAWALPAAFILFTLEFMVGVCLVLNLKPKSTARVSFVLMLIMTMFTLYVLLKNPVSDCGCFGDVLILDNRETFYKNIMLLVLTLLILLLSRRSFATFVPAAEWALMGASLVFILGLASYGLLTLPVMDFRPYKIGVSISEGMALPEGAKPDTYETTFIYAQDGVEREFTLEDYPKDDSTWVFVRQNTVLVEKGYVPPIHDFSIITEDMEDITYEVLDEPGWTVLVVMYDLNKSNLKQVRKLNAFYEKSRRQGAAFYALTGSGEADIEAFRQRTGASYPFCFTDPTTLKTMIRANPGIVLLRKGVIVNKWNVRSL